MGFPVPSIHCTEFETFASFFSQPFLSTWLRLGFILSERCLPHEWLADHFIYNIFNFEFVNLMDRQRCPSHRGWAAWNSHSPGPTDRFFLIFKHGVIDLRKL